MSYQNISAVMTQADVDAVKAAYATINAKMPFLVALTKEERKSMFKLGPKSVDFAADAQLAATNFPGILPNSFSVAEYNKDTNLFKNLTEIKMLSDSTAERINDTYTAVGNESMRGSLLIYKYVDTAKDAIAGLKTVYLKLKERFKNQGKKKSTISVDSSVH
jgi:hypothetical protein